MSKEKTEGHFYQKIKTFGSFTLSKIQVNPFACTSERGDYFIQSEDLDIVVECKEVLMTHRKSTPRFSLNRFSQEFKMSEWEEVWPRNKGFLFLNYWEQRKDKSSTFLIPIKIWIERKKKIPRSFLMREEAEELFADCKLDNQWDDLKERLKNDRRRN